MSTSEVYKYDVALSFLNRDIDLAGKINEGLKDRLRVFYFPERQTELVSQDGEERLTKIFLRDSRLDVVLYRDGWGDSPWTRVEERAIRTRSFKEQDYEDFLIVLVVSEEKQPPDWLPPHIIYGDPLRYGVSSAITTIETVLKGFGLNVPPETPEQRAERLDRGLSWLKDKTAFLQSRGIVQHAHEHAQGVLDTIVSRAKDIGDKSSALHLNVLRIPGQYGGAEISSPTAGERPFVLDTTWRYTYLNSLDSSGLTARLLSGFPRRPNRITSREPSEIAKRNFRFDLAAPEVVGWTEAENEEFFPGLSVSEELLSWYFTKLEDRIS